MIIRTNLQKNLQDAPRSKSTAQWARRAKLTSTKPSFLVPIVLGAAAVIGWTLNAGWPVVFSFTFAAIALVPNALFAGLRTTIDPFEPYIGLSLLLYLYSISTLLFVEENHFNYFTENVTSSALSEFAVACLLGQAGLVLGYLVAPKDRGRVLNPGVVNYADPRIRLLIGPFLIVAALFLPFYIDRFNFFAPVSYADAALETRIVRIDDPVAGIKDVFLRDWAVTVSLCVITLVMFDPRRWLWTRVAVVAVLGAYLMQNALSGWRSHLVMGMLLPAMFYHYRVRQFSMRTILLSALLVYVLVNALAVMRSSSDVYEMFQLLRIEVEDHGLAFLQLSNSGELATSSNLLTLIGGMQSGETSLQWGSLLLSQVGAFVPRAIWFDRPLMGSERFVTIFYPGILGEGGGYGYFFLQDGYWDFGLFGVILYSAWLGWMVRWIYVKLMIQRSATFWTLLYALVYGQLVMGVVRSGVVGSIKATLMVALPLLVIAWVGSKVRHAQSAGKSAIK